MVRKKRRKESIHSDHSPEEETEAMMGKGTETCSFKIPSAQGFMMDVPLVVNWNLKKDIESLPFPSPTITQL